MSKNNFENNSAVNGGAFSMDFSENSTVSTTIERCLFSNNTAAGGNGGAFFVKHEPGITHPTGLKVQYSTIYNNPCSGMGRMAFADNAPLFANEVISWSASASPAQSEFATINGGAITVTQSTIQSPDCATAGIIGCAGNIYGQDPLFVNAGASDLHLQKCSPAVNGGGNSGTTITDYDNNPRPYNDGTGLLDMGAYEYQGPKTGCVQANCKNITVNLNAAGSSTVAAGDINNNSTGCTLTFQINNQASQTYNCAQIGNQVATLKATDCTGNFASCLATITVKDVNNNTGTCTAYVTVKDNIAPTAVCTNITVPLGSYGNVTVYPSSLAANSYDNCSVTSYSPGAKVYTAANYGNNNLTITVKDWSGNAATCVSVVTVVPHASSNSGTGNREQEAGVLTDFALRLYPNPASENANLQFDLPAAQDFTVRVFDLSGRIILNQVAMSEAGEHTLRLDMASVAPGVYVVDFQSNDLKAQKRLVVQHD